MLAGKQILNRVGAKECVGEEFHGGIKEVPAWKGGTGKALWFWKVKQLHVRIRPPLVSNRQGGRPFSWVRGMLQQRRSPQTCREVAVLL